MPISNAIANINTRS